MLVTLNPIPPSFLKHTHTHTHKNIHKIRHHCFMCWRLGDWASLSASSQGWEEMKADSEMCPGETASNIVSDGTLG